MPIFISNSLEKEATKLSSEILKSKKDAQKDTSFEGTSSFTKDSLRPKCVEFQRQPQVGDIVKILGELRVPPARNFENATDSTTIVKPNSICVVIDKVLVKPGPYDEDTFFILLDFQTGIKFSLSKSGLCLISGICEKL